MIPREILEIVPKFDGDDKQLNLFLRKAQYVIERFRLEENPAQDIYVFHTITSRLIGKAACLLSEREDIQTWPVLRTVLRQHFGDPRSEECIAIELENLKIKQGETYTQFCNRIQHVRSTLIAKVNEIDDVAVRNAKVTIYTNTSLNTFLYNLPENMIRVVRLKDCYTLEEALSVVTEEVNFQFQYESKHHSKTASQQPKAPQPILPLYQNNNPNPNFKFGYPQPNSGLQNKFGAPNQGFRPMQYQPQGFRFPQNQAPQGFKFNQGPQGQGFKFGIPNQQTNFKFGIHPQQQGFRPQFNNYYKPQTGFVGNQPQQFRFGIPNAQGQAQRPYEHNDVSMRTVKQHTLTVPQDIDNLFYYNNDLDSAFDDYYEDPYFYCEEPDPTILPIAAEAHVEPENKAADSHSVSENENFQLLASEKRNRK